MKTNRLQAILGASLLTLLCAATPAQSAERYKEPFRPQFHFTPATNWMNDPNGMVFYEGEYHLFYQYNPFGDKWGHMSWGHAVSPDMLHWEHLPVALYEENDIMIFSGSAVIDWKNTSGFGINGKPPMVAIYTGHYTKKPLQNQQIAYSNDRGRTWTKYSENPVLDIGAADFRDPKVMWHEASKKWVMTVAWPVERKVRFYSSPNLKDWAHLSDFGPTGSTSGIWECPDLFPVTVEGKPGGGEKWVLIVNVGGGAPAGGSGCQYFIGNFDGKQFTLDESHPKRQPEFIPPGKVLADFEGGSYGDWQATGDAFGTAPAAGTLPNQQMVDGFKGKGLVNSYLKGDATQGTLTSPEFEVTQSFLSFLIGGGKHPGKTCMNLLVEGKIVRTATGDAAERLSWKAWDVREFRGKKAKLEIVDKHSEGWGHVNVDEIILAETPAHSAIEPVLWADFGPDFYAAVSWSDVPKRDGRRLWLGWMSNWQYANDVPTSPWRSAMSLPRELSLRQTALGLRLAQEPVREVRKLHEQKERLKNATVAEANEWLRNNNVGGPLWELVVEFQNSAGDTNFGMRIPGGEKQETVIHCDLKKQVVSLDRTKSGRVDFHGAFPGRYEAPLPAADQPIQLHLFIDTSSIELFANQATSVISALVLPDDATRPVEIWSSTDTLRIRNLEIRKLKPSMAQGAAKNNSAK
ncbi:MAG: glycoside hydrolase family 32 protein [Verrucomicrobiales bacterium]